MANWHYQVMRHPDGDLAIHEYYPSEKGDGWTKNPVSVDGDSIGDIEQSLRHMLEDLKKYGIKDYE